MDEDGRELERKWRATGLDEDGERYLAALLRTGAWPPRGVIDRLVRLERMMTAMTTPHGRLEESSQAIGQVVTVGDLIRWMEHVTGPDALIFMRPTAPAVLRITSTPAEHEERLQRIMDVPADPVGAPPNAEMTVLDDNCPRCGGQGAVPYGRGMVDCPVCIPAAPPRFPTTCPTCEGERTLVHRQGHRVNCPSCHGAGHVPITCGRCMRVLTLQERGAALRLDDPEAGPVVCSPCFTGWTRREARRGLSSPAAITRSIAAHRAEQPPAPKRPRRPRQKKP